MLNYIPQMSPLNWLILYFYTLLLLLLVNVVFSYSYLIYNKYFVTKLTKKINYKWLW